MAAATDAPSTPPRLGAIFATFLKVGAMSFGGGLTGWLYRELVTRRRWLAEADFLGGIALAQVLPGTNVVNLAIYAGSRLRGWAGATAAVLGLLIVPFFAVIALAAIYADIAAHPWARRFMAGVAAAAVGLTLSAGLRAAGRNRGIGAIAAMLIVIVAIGILRWPLVPVALCTIPASLLIARQAAGKRDA
jgi:chromate transporter